MKVLRSFQLNGIADPVRSKFAMVVPVLEATLYSLNRDRVERLGGYEAISLADLAREFREGSGDAGICFEYAVHDAIARREPRIYNLASEVLQSFCGIPGGSDSLLFGPEKDGAIPVVESIQNALTDDSVVYVGNRGRPPKLRRYIPQIVRAFRRHEERNRLPRSINGLWKADLFLGSRRHQGWVGTTVKINPAHLEPAQGLRIGIYPKQNNADGLRIDANLNIVRLPLPYDAGFMELFYKSFFLVRAFLKADAQVPPPVSLPDAEDRYITQELTARREFAILAVMEAVRDMSQQDLIENQGIRRVDPTAIISEAAGLQEEPNSARADTGYVSLSPEARE